MKTNRIILAGLMLVGVLTLSYTASAGAKTTQNTLNTAAIDAYIENHMAEHQIPGLALAIVHNDEIVYTQGYGVAGPDGTPVTPQTPFLLCSLSKSFTALAIMQLVEAGEIELDASVQTYLPWFTMAGPEPAERITVRHLLTHSSGLSFLAGDKDLVNPDVSEGALETHIRELADYKLTRPVGESFAYANTGYDILGLIVQTVSGQSFEDYIQEHIFTPLEMTNSYTSKSEADANGLATGHTYFFGNPKVADDAPYPRRKIPSGFLIVSAQDLGNYLIAQINQGSYGEEQILSPEHVSLMHQPGFEKSAAGVSYAFGWNTKLIEGEPSLWHDGNTSNFHSNMAFSPARGWGVSIVMNVTGAPQLGALNEPVNQVYRLASGYDAGQPMEDLKPFFLVLWGIAILSAVLNLVSWAISYRRHKNKGRQLGLVRYLLLPLGINFVPMWIMFIWFPSQLNSFWSTAAMFEFAPDTSPIFIVSAVVILLAMFLRVGMYYQSLKASTVGKDKIGHR